MIFGRYRKAVAAVVIPLLGWAYAVVESAPEAVTSKEWVAFGVALATGLGVYVIPNKD